ncbi:MAG TPA: hypothetical protein VMM76_11885, partial [Pirellulaceae bacterium]|nr:hypothetical protein [Pirellulaceae bacterium]
TSVCYLPDGNRIASGSWDGTIRIWEVESDVNATILQRHESIARYEEDEIVHLAYLAVGKKIMSVARGGLCIWDGQRGIKLKEFESVAVSSRYSQDARRCAQFCPSSDEHLASLEVWKPRTGKVRWKHEWEDRQSCEFDLSPDGKKIGFTEKMQRRRYVVKIIDISTGNELVSLRGHDRQINDVRFSANGDVVATASDDRTVRIWDVETGESLTRIQHEAAVRKVWFSPDGVQIVALDDKDNLRVFDFDGGIEYFALEQNGQRIKDICFSPDGTRLVAAAFGEVFVWDTRTGKLIAAIQGRGDIKAIAAEVEGMSFRLLDQSGETIIQTPSGQIVARYPHAVWSLIASHPDGCTWAGFLGDYFALLHLEGTKNS